MKKTNTTYEITDGLTKKDCNRRTALERKLGWGGVLLPDLFVQNLTLNSDTTPNYKHMFGLHGDHLAHPLRKHACSNLLKILPPKNENLQIKNSYIFHIPAQSIDCGYSLEPPRRGGFNGYPQSMFLSRNKKNNVYPCKPQFFYTKGGFKGGQYYIDMFS